MGLQGTKAGKLIEDLIDPIKRLESRVAQLEANEGLGFSVNLIQALDLSIAGVSIDFTSIPATYKQLQLVVAVRSSVAATTDILRIRINNDSGANYDSHIYTITTALSATVASGGTSGYGGHIAGNTSPANTFSPFIFIFPNYVDASNCPVWSSTGGRVVSTADVQSGGASGRLRTVGAISRITLLPETGPNFVAGSYASLYGIG